MELKKLLTGARVERLLIAVWQLFPDGEIVFVRKRAKLCEDLFRHGVFAHDQREAVHPAFANGQNGAVVGPLDIRVKGVAVHAASAVIRCGDQLAVL